MSARGQRRGHDRITRADRPLPTMRGVRRADAVAALSTRSDAQVDAIAHPRWPPRRGRCRLEMACPTGIYSTPAAACLLTTRIRILLLPVVQATGRSASAAAAPDGRNQPQNSPTLSVDRTEPAPHRMRDAEPGARVTQQHLEVHRKECVDVHRTGGVGRAVVTIRQRLDSGVHFGHQTRRWNPKMKRFIFTERNGIYIIDLQKSLGYIDNAFEFVKETVAHGGTILFVGTKKQAQESIAEQAKRVGQPYVNQRWLGGMLTNFQTISGRLRRLKELEEIDFDDVAGSSHTKKELLILRREKDKL